MSVRGPWLNARRGRVMDARTKIAILMGEDYLVAKCRLG